MQIDTRRRVLGYSGAALALGTLAYGGWFHGIDADPGTLVACASAQMQLAQGLTADTPDANELRARMLDDADGFLRRAERLAAGSASVRVARADYHALRGDPDAALQNYERAIDAADCSPEGVSMLRVRRADLQLQLGRADAALAELGHLRAADTSQLGNIGDVIESRAFIAKGDVARARAALDRLAARGDIESSLYAADGFEAIGDDLAAERCYRESHMPLHVAEYRVARLKLRRAQIDTAVELLGRAVLHDRSEVLRLMQRDSAEWQVCAEHAGFRGLTDHEVAAPR